MILEKFMLKEDDKKVIFRFFGWEESDMMD